MHTHRPTRLLSVFGLAAAVMLTAAQSSRADGYWRERFDQLEDEEEYLEESLEAELKDQKAALKSWYRNQQARLEWEIDRLDDLPGPAAARLRSYYREQLRLLEDEYDRRRDALEDYYEELEDQLERRYEYASDALRAQRRAYGAALHPAAPTIVAPAVVYTPGRRATRRAARATRRGIRRAGSLWIYY